MSFRYMVQYMHVPVGACYLYLYNNVTSVYILIGSSWSIKGHTQMASNPR